jgi:hypothetical protein
MVSRKFYIGPAWCRGHGMMLAMMVLANAAYEIEAWDGFATAQVGAAATLAGLLVVAVSINVGRILQLPSVVSRLAATLVLFGAVLIVGTILLVPDQGEVLAGIELAVVGLLTAVSVFRLRGTRGIEKPYRINAVVVGALGVAAALLIAASGIFCALSTMGGLYWVVPGVVLAVVLGLANSWVALIEILR